MAAAAAATSMVTAASASSRRPLLPQQVAFSGMRSTNKLDALSSKCSSSFESKTLHAKSRAKINCLETSLIICLCTATSLSLGRFVFLPYQREALARNGPGKQNGKTHFEAGDTRAQEMTSLLKSNDPAGFHIVDVLSWGSIGHIVAYFILATSSNGYEPQF